MVFGNKGESSGTGVCFTRDPSTGESILYGEFLVNAQGEDVVSGIRTPEPISAMKSQLPEAYAQLIETLDRLEAHYRDMQDIEFTVEEGRLYLLQTRTGKRTATAALRIAVEMAGEGVISREEAVSRIDPGQLDQLLHPMIDPTAEVEVAAQGLNASPGAASGEIVLDADTAAERGKAGDDVILVRWETTPDDIHGLIQARGVLTAHGGMTSHAAVVARGMGKPCVAGCEGLSIDARAGTVTIGEHVLDVGDVITIDGGTGRVIVGPVRLVPPAIDENFGTILDWADQLRRLRVRANADTPEDAAKAREFGAEGIGLCRTEHMFMAQDRLPIVQEMIMARDEAARRVALDKLLPVQQSDFEGIFEAMAGFPVTIRLLDPPLHEFLPSLEEATSDEMRKRIAELHESNPMLGTRGCRLGLQWPEIYEMQVRAIVRAAAAVGERTGAPPLVEIMHPLVGFREELARLRELTERIAAEEPAIEYLCGTMIELPRACVRADEIAEVADFCSFGTNDLTQTALGFSRDDAEGKFLTYYLEHGILERNPFEVLDQDGVGELMRIGVERGSRRQAGPEDGDLRRARRRAALGCVLPRARARLRQLLALPGSAGTPGRRAGSARRRGCDSAGDRRVGAATGAVQPSATTGFGLRPALSHRPGVAGVPRPAPLLDSPHERGFRRNTRDRHRPRADRPDRDRSHRADRAAGERGHRRAPRALPAHARPRSPLPRPVPRSPAAARRHARAGRRVPAAARDHAGQRDDLDRYGLLLHGHRCVSRHLRGRRASCSRSSS